MLTSNRFKGDMVYNYCPLGQESQKKFSVICGLWRGGHNAPPPFLVQRSYDRVRITFLITFLTPKSLPPNIYRKFRLESRKPPASYIRVCKTSNGNGFRITWVGPMGNLHYRNNLRVTLLNCLLNLAPII